MKALILNLALGAILLSKSAIAGPPITWGSSGGSPAAQLFTNYLCFLDNTCYSSTNIADLGSNTFTDTQTITKNSLGTTRADGLLIQNTTAATSGNQQISPSLRLRGAGYKTSSTAASQPVDWDFDVLPIQGSATPRSTLRIRSQVNNGGYTDAVEITDKFADGISIPKLKTLGLFEVSTNGSNTQPGTVDHVTLTNPGGNYTHEVHLFGSTQKSAWTYDSSGNINSLLLNSGAFTFGFYSSLPGSYTTQHGIYPGGSYWSGYSVATGTMSAGSGDVNPNATLNTYGSFSSKGEIKTESFTVDQTAKKFYCDASSTSVCSGTPSTTACSSYTGSGQIACEAHSLAGCVWNPGESCAPYGGVDQSTCESGHSGCTFDQSECSSANNTDSTTCSNLNSPYGGSCSWDSGSTCAAQSDTASCNAIPGCSASEGNSCSAFNGDYSGCSSQVGCTPDNSGDCASIGDEASCLSAGGASQCTWNGSSCEGGPYFTACNGNYFSSCDGSLCQNQYFNGGCSGTTGTSCSGTASCAPIPTANCTSESGCSVTTELTATLPSISTHLGLSDGKTGFEVGVKNIGSTGTVTLRVDPATTDTFEDGSTSITISPTATNSPKPYVEIHPVNKTAGCEAFDNNESACNSSGCTFTASTCGSFPVESCPTGNGCFVDGDNCNGTYTGSNGSCSGNYSVFKRWMIWGRQ